MGRMNWLRFVCRGKTAAAGLSNRKYTAFHPHAQAAAGTFNGFHSQATVQGELCGMWAIRASTSAIALGLMQCRSAFIFCNLTAFPSMTHRNTKLEAVVSQSAVTNPNMQAQLTFWAALLRHSTFKNCTPTKRSFRHTT
jgi:hypothetical protein